MSPLRGLLRSSATGGLRLRLHHLAALRVEPVSYAIVAASRLRCGWYDPGTTRLAMLSRFQALIVAMAKVRSASSFSLKCGRTSSYTESGTWPLVTRVTASVQANAARSRSLYKGDSRQASSR